MGSFKLEKAGSDKQQATSAGALLIVLGLVFGVVVDLRLALALALFGLVLLIGGNHASS